VAGEAHHCGAAVGRSECDAPASSTASAAAPTARTLTTPPDGAHDHSPARCGRYDGTYVPIGNGSYEGDGVIAARAASTAAASKRTRYSRPCKPSATSSPAAYDCTVRQPKHQRIRLGFAPFHAA
jgi:hypothetical protein